MWNPYDDDADLDDEDYFDDDDRSSLHVQALLMHGLMNQLSRREQARRNAEEEPAENQQDKAQQIKEACRLKQAGLISRNEPTIEPEFGRFFNDPTYSDVTLVVGPRTFHAHRLILSSWSSVFQDILMKGDLALAEDGGLPTYLLQEYLDCCAVFDTFLKFLYTEEITFSKDTVMPLLKLSNKYKITELSKLCDSFVRDLKLDVPSAIAVLIEARKYKMGDTVESCISVLRSNFELMTPEQLQVLDSSLIIALLDCKDQSIVVKDEFSLFEKLTPWLANCTDNEIFKTVIECVRFPFMSAEQLKAVGSTDIMRRIEEVIGPTFLAEAFEQHALYHESYADDLQTPVPLPRLYLKPPGAMFGQPGAPTRRSCDKEGFWPMGMKFDMESSQEYIQNALINGKQKRGQSHYRFDNPLKWIINIKPFRQTKDAKETIKKRDVGHDNMFGLKIAFLIEAWQVPGYGYTRDADKVLHKAGKQITEDDHRDQIVEAAVQVKYPDGSSHVLASRCSLAPARKDQKEDRFITFKTPCHLQSIPHGIKIRVSMVIHQGPEVQSTDK